MTLAFRPPSTTDAAAIWKLAPQRGTGGQESCYSFLLLCSHFADTGVVAEEDGKLVGYALGYRPPVNPQEAFVCQLGVADDRDRIEMVPRLLEELLARRANRDARFLCMTASPQDNSLQEALTRAARRLSARCAVEPCFPASFFAEPHVDENLVRIGPLS